MKDFVWDKLLKADSAAMHVNVWVYLLKRQRPLAAVLSGIDSRTTPEIIFDTSVGDLFTARVGGNVINDDILGSLEISYCQRSTG